MSATRLRYGTIIVEPGGNSPTSYAYRNINKNFDTTDEVDQRLQTVELEYVKKSGTEPLTGSLNAGGYRIRNVNDPSSSSDAATKAYVDSLVSAQETGRTYKGTVEGGPDTGTATDLTVLDGYGQEGAYYVVSTDGFVTDGTTVTEVVSGDEVVFLATSGYEVIPVIVSSVSGTSNFITVDELAGREYKVDIDQAFKDRVSNIESWTTDDLTEGSANLFFTETRARQSISGSGDVSYNPSTGVISVDSYTSSNFDTDFASKTTDDLQEGNINLFYSDTRSRNAIQAGEGLSYEPMSGTLALDLVDGGTF